jgi:TM2 domain-containing membrane protein YozV
MIDMGGHELMSRNLAIDGGHELCAEMYNKGVMALLIVLVQKVCLFLACLSFSYVLFLCTILDLLNDRLGIRDHSYNRIHRPSTSSSKALAWIDRECLVPNLVDGRNEPQDSGSCQRRWSGGTVDQSLGW